MTAYHQMGHDSENLLTDTACVGFTGAIASPVDYTEQQVRHQVATHPDLEWVLDPQLYSPRSGRGCLSKWEYFPQDVDTADLGSLEWWANVNRAIAATAERLKVGVVCSPAVQPRVYSDEYFGSVLDVASALADELDTTIETIPTLMLQLADLAGPHRVDTIASIVSGTRFHRAYLVFTGGPEPRREIVEPQDLRGACQLIRALEQAGTRCIVGFTSSDAVLWRAAGASACATGKFFNLRRFTPSRFAPPSGGGGQLAYWFEEGLFAFLREADLRRLREGPVISEASRNNPSGHLILRRLASQTGQAWLADSWRQYLWWFRDAMDRFSTDGGRVRRALASAAQNWRSITEEGFVPEEPGNDGRWIAAWRDAIAEV
jgi:hypothetical protein